MTTIFNDQNNQVQTHVLIIGVGQYLYLEGGEGGEIDDTMGLRQLSSAPLSAVEFANWIITKHHNPDAELGSVELLISSKSSDIFFKGNENERQDIQIKFNDITSTKQDSGEQKKIDKAKILNIETAFKEWKSKCDRNENNVAIFYFCGHGVEKNGELSLLAEDFGEDLDNLTKNSINFTWNYEGMKMCQAKKQYYFIDACRVATDLLKKYPRMNSQVFIELNVEKQRQRTDAPIFFACAENDRASSYPNEVSFFTKALIECLNEIGSIREKSRWVIKSTSLHDALTKSLKNTDINFNDKSWPKSGECSEPSIIHVLNDTPTLPIKISFSLPDAARSTYLYLKKNEKVKYNREPNEGDWETRVLANNYEIKTNFTDNIYHCLSNNLEIWATKAFVEEELPIEKTKKELSSEKKLFDQQIRA